MLILSGRVRLSLHLQTVYGFIIAVILKQSVFSNSLQGTCGYGPGPRDVGQQNHHQWSEELPQVSSPRQLCVLRCQESSLSP